MHGIRPATAADLPAVHAIFTHYVTATTASFLVHAPPPSYTQTRFDAARARRLPFLVAATPQNQITGYACAGAYRGHALGYAHTVEISLFVHDAHTGGGIGSALMAALLEALQSCVHAAREDGAEERVLSVPVRRVLAVVSLGPPGAVSPVRDWYVRRWGFAEVGRLQGVGEKMGWRECVAGIS